MFGMTVRKGPAGGCRIAERFPVSAVPACIIQPWDRAGQEEAVDFLMGLAFTGFNHSV